ncbi:MAG TPA: hypothetical protein VJN89_09050, partial [Candidatus Acidoferrum sp.]|nr:hypothetical protein [Candidatus Acidoferrum sp.]
AFRTRTLNLSSRSRVNRDSGLCIASGAWRLRAVRPLRVLDRATLAAPALERLTPNIVYPRRPPHLFS